MTKKIDYERLKNYLETLKYADFQKDGIIKHANLIDDIENFKLDKSKFTLDTVINYGDSFLLDALGNDLSICILSKRRHKLQNGRVIGAKFDRTIISNVKKTLGDHINGCWVIPQQFYIVEQ